ncbi:MAG: hypothetical protein ACYTE8_00420 [Planctomycetota bacterium]|jgi:hypothetical protein
MTTNFIPLPEVPVEIKGSLWSMVYSLRDAAFKVIELFQRGDKTWAYPVLLNGWIGYSAGDANEVWPGLAYWKDASDIVHLRGLVKSGTPSATSIVAHLPTGYRPSMRQAFPAVCFDNTIVGRIDVTPSGEVIIIEGHTTWTSTCLSFRAEN